VKLVAYAFAINPQPWVAPTFGVGKFGGKFRPTPTPDKTLVTYQEAIRASLREAGATPLSGPYSLRFTFSRELEQFLTPSGRRKQRNAADATNMQKATEDALQKVLIENDVDVHYVVSDRCAQGVAIKPFVIIELKYENEYQDRHFPPFLTAQGQEAFDKMLADEQKRFTAHDNVWRP